MAETLENKNFLRTMLVLAVPMAMQNLISFLVQIADTVMVGSLGDTAVSAVSLASQPYYIFTALVFGISSGGTVLISQYWGKGDRTKIHAVMTITLWMTIVLSGIYGALCLLFPSQIIGIFSKDAEVIAAAVPYLRIIVISYVFNGLALCYLCALKAAEDVNIATMIYIGSLCIKVLLNGLLMFGFFGLPALGIRGAAIATVAARAFETIACVIYAQCRERKIGYRFGEMLHIDRTMFRPTVQQSIPVVMHELNWSLATSAQVAVIGNVSSVFVTAQSIASVSQNLSVAFLQGIATASAVMIGKSIGSGEKKEADRMTVRFLWTALFTGICCCMIMLMLRQPMMLLYPNISAESKALSMQLMRILSVLTISISVEYVCTIGILRGAGDTTFAFLADAGCMWLIGIPLGFAGAHIFHVSSGMIYLMLKSDTLFKVIICLLRIHHGNFMKDVTLQKSVSSV